MVRTPTGKSVVGTIADQPAIDTRQLFAVERQSLLEVLEVLTPEQWSAPTVCAGWSVHDVALHLLWIDISNISRRRDGYFGRPEDDPGALDDLQSVIDFVNQLNENWVSSARRLSPALLRSLLAVTGEEWAAWVSTVDISAMGSSVGWSGPDPAPVWLDIAREFTERWVHQQHIRDATGIPGGAEQRFLQPVIAAFAMALPYALRDVHAEEGAEARLVITGGSGGVWAAVRREEAWRFANANDSAETSGTLTIDQDAAWRLFTRGISRGDANSQVTGDPRIGSAILDMVTILA